MCKNNVKISINEEEENTGRESRCANVNNDTTV
jgi:hypothetical protein